MSANTFGNFFKVTTFGESHGSALGVVIDGCPAGVEWSEQIIRENVALRRPGQSEIVTSRNEADAFEVLSGVFEGKTLGTPIAIVVRNSDQRSKDYSKIKDKPRVGHADDTWKSKFGHVDYRGGGRSSGRETVSRVLAGSVAQMLLNSLHPQIKVMGFTQQISTYSFNEEIDAASYLYSKTKKTRIPNQAIDEQVSELLLRAKEEGNSYGGTVGCKIANVPANLGEPVFLKFKAVLAQAMLSIGATTGFEFGSGFDAVDKEGSLFHSEKSDQAQYGGVRGGITTGEDISFKVAFKPTSSVLHVAQNGRHDPCIVPRAVAVVEAMVWVVLADFYLARRLNTLS